MKKGISLQELAARIEGNRALKYDYIAPANQLAIRPDTDGVVSLISPKEAGVGPLPLLSTAHDQLGAFVGIPAKYYDKMLEQAPRLLSDNVNEWLARDERKRMVRTLGGDVRSFNSNSYQRIEHEEIAEVALPIISEIPDVQIVACELTERRMYIQFTTPRIAGEVKKGDVVQAGGIISNSEIGYGSVSIASTLWRLICLNGLTTADNFKKYHVGRRIEDNDDLWRDDTKKADDRAVLLKVRDMVRAAVDETRFGQHLAKLQGLTQTRVTGNPAEAVEVLAKKVGATETEKGGILRALIEGGDLTAWGLVNAVTAQAHDAVSFDRAVEIERLGGQLVDLSQKEWKEILIAA